MDEVIHVVDKVNDLPDIFKALLPLQGGVQLANLGGVKLIKPRRKVIEFVNLCGAYHVIRQGKVPVLVVGVAMNKKVLRIVGGKEYAAALAELKPIAEALEAT